MARKRDTGFGTRLRELREQAGMTQVQLAERAGMHLHGLTKIEQGDREPGWATVQDLAEALGVSCEAFNQPPSGEAEPRSPGRPSKQPAAPPKPKRGRGRPKQGE